MSDNTILDTLYQVIMGGLVMPLVSWLKAKLPTDFPLQTTLLSAVLSIGTVFVLNRLFTLNMPWEEIINYALGTFASATAWHAVKKTGQETKAPAPTPSVMTSEVTE